VRGAWASHRLRGVGLGLGEFYGNGLLSRALDTQPVSGAPGSVREKAAAGGGDLDHRDGRRRPPGRSARRSGTGRRRGRLARVEGGLVSGRLFAVGAPFQRALAALPGQLLG
jgi:hypothetical protein